MVRVTGDTIAFSPPLIIGESQIRHAVETLSKSGETEELFGLLAALQRLNVPIIALTGGAASTLAKVAREVLDAGVAEA